MNTPSNKVTLISEDSELDRLSDEFLKAGYAYWQEYNKQNPTSKGAVTFVRHLETGHFVCFTRGEYANDLIEKIISF